MSTATGSPADRVTALELQVLAHRGWPAVEQWEGRELPGWTLRAAGGFTRRANSALPIGGLGPGGTPRAAAPPATAADFRAAADALRAWYAERGLPAYVQVCGGTEDARLDAVLAELGWVAETPTELHTGPLAPLTGSGPGPGSGPVSGSGSGEEPAGVLLTRSVDAGWAALYHRAGTLDATSLAVLTGGPSVWFATVPGADGRPEAIGRCVVDGAWAGFSGIEVRPDRRRRGLARRVMAALADRARSEGAVHGWLQVEADNAPALRMYAGLGFRRHHGYHYRRAVGTG
ncbi:GNAT family N-acetyltransferase [Allostreptomyces psammosilenae]|uniref:Ribosomal protein S18 acetylase RimI-like enzyme n=1 Tax=Allostreptomyces psammosilenae TaxID=1892865 RepID=A0A853ABW9_9ACTN|nr:GNAT family N-acetyltransferase [Allostreptomyces psammosilenae]NYI08081.1 ribosomal protein S18 acetylase RimI-like enzyme [Allostreptomyces psammosilenae]